MDKIFIIIEFALMILLFIIAKYSVKRPSNRWRLLYAAPVFVAIIVAICEGFDVYHAGIYFASALPLWSLFLEEKKVRAKQLIATCSALIIAANLVVICVAPNYHKVSYLKDFEQGFETMREHYVLTQEKEIDWDRLYAKYHPMFEAVEEKQDYVENYKAWQCFTTEFFDGHVGYEMDGEKKLLDAICRSYGNDYGLSLARMTSGEFVAINVEGYERSYSIEGAKEDELGLYSVKKKFLSQNASADRLTLKNAGITNGTVITKWNGKAIDAYFDEVDYYFDQYPVRENEAFYQPIYVAGIGSDMAYGETYVPGKDGKASPSVSISFLDENGMERTVEAPCLGSYAPRMLDTFGKLGDGLNITNLNWQEVSTDTYAIRISEMSYDQETYGGTDYQELTEKLREEVLALKDVGVKTLIFDLRSNCGGSPYFVEAIAKLFAPKGEHLSYYSAVINEKTASYERGADGKYQKGVVSAYEGEDLWHDGEILLLVNASTVSAGDDMVYMMGEYPNVKVTGFTRSNSSCQAVIGITLDAGRLAFSAVPNLLPSGEVAIDTFADHVGRTPFDELVPFDQEAVKVIFDQGEDYLLSYIMASK
jgi:fumarate reductase subunit C